MAKKWPTVSLFVPKRPDKYIGDPMKIELRSNWERKFARWCDENPSVINWNSEGVKIPYWSSADNKQRTYHVDFLIVVKTINGEITYLVEIKPKSQTLKPVLKKHKRQDKYLNECYTYQVNMDKWMHAKIYAEKRNMKFIVMTEEHLYGSSKS